MVLFTFKSVTPVREDFEFCFLKGDRLVFTVGEIRCYDLSIYSPFSKSFSEKQGCEIR